MKVACTVLEGESGGNPADLLRIKKKGFIMKAIMSMDSIYEMLSSLTDTNKKW